MTLFGKAAGFQDATAFGPTNAVNRATRTGPSSVAWYGPAIATAVAFGVTAALGSKIITILAFGAMGGLILLFSPAPAVLAFFIVLTFLIIGPITSIGHIYQVVWAPYVIALALLIRVPMELHHTSTLKNLRYGTSSAASSPVIWAVACYFGLMLLSLTTNRPLPMQVLIGAKLYLFVWGIFFLLLVSSISPQFLEWMWKGFLVLAVLQLPFALYQRIVEVPTRVLSVSRLDAIVGTFTGTKDGGANGSLALFLVFAMALALSLWRKKLLGSMATLVVVLASLASIALGEVKVIILLFPLAFLVLNRREVVRRPLQFLISGLLVGSILGGILWIYQDAAKLRSSPNLTMSKYMEKKVREILDPNQINYELGEVGRVAALNLWYRDERRTVNTFLLGYGPAASQNSTQLKGEVAARYLPLKINGTSAAGMLWDIGVLGFAAFVAIGIIGFFEALRLANAPHVPPFHRSVLEACAFVIAGVTAMLPYIQDFLVVPPHQVLFLLALAQVVYWGARAEA